MQHHPLLSRGELSHGTVDIDLKIQSMGGRGDRLPIFICLVFIRRAPPAQGL